MSDSLLWKDMLLNSGIPMELDAARLLVSEGFSVNSDISYILNHGNSSFNGGIDLHGEIYLPFGENNGSVCLDFLINCSHCHGDALWMFSPNPNNRDIFYKNSGTALRIIDQFSPFRIPQEEFAGFESQSPQSFRGMEINIATGEDSGSDFMAKLFRLQYFMPSLITDRIFTFLTGPPHENFPFLICPLLLTTAPIYLLDKDITPKDIKAASRIEDISEKKTYIIMETNISPDFKHLCMDQSRPLEKLLRTDEAMEIEMKKARFYQSRSNLPFTIIEAFIRGDYFYLARFFTRFFICSQDGFPGFIRHIKSLVDSGLKSCK